MFDRMERMFEELSTRMTNHLQEQLSSTANLLRDQMRVMQQQHEERVQAILAQDQTRAVDPPSPTVHAASRRNQPRRSTAARTFLGAEDQTDRDILRPTGPPHLAARPSILNPLETPGAARQYLGHSAPGTTDGLRPRRFTPTKPTDIGLYEPDKGRDIFSWWCGVVQYQAYSGATEAEIFSGLPGCFSKWPRQWLDELVPRPETLKEFRNRAFQAFMRDATLIQHDVDQRQFKPDEESLENYLSDKYRLVSELQIAKAITAGHTDFDNPEPEAARILMTVKDAIQTVHNGLPAHWRPFMNLYRQEEDWPAYRSQLLANEHATREAIAVFSGNAREDLGQSKSWAKPSPARNAISAPAVASGPPLAAVAATIQVPAASSDNTTRRKDREENNCYHCHLHGHFKHECPQRVEDLKTAHKSVRYNDYDSDNEDVARVIVSRATNITIDDENDVQPIHFTPPTRHNWPSPDDRALIRNLR
ncbi:hypothetical protein V8E36_003708 [Tilletia maclaganii]